MQCKDTNLELIRKTFEKIISGLENKEANKTLHEAEKWIFKELLQLGCLLLQHYTSGLVQDDKTKNKERSKMNQKNCGLKKRTLITIFGVIEIVRSKFYDRATKKVVCPFDIEHKISESKFSYTLQDWIGKSSTENTYQESVSQVNRILNSVCTKRTF